MFVTTDNLELLRLLLAIALVVANIAVWGGVYFEGDKFSEKTKKLGWKMLVIALAAEAAFAAVLVVTDSTINNRQKAEILNLEMLVGGRQLTPELNKSIAADLKPFANRNLGCN